MRGKLRIPKSQEDSVARFLSMPDEAISALAVALSDANYASSIRRLSDSVADAAGVSESDAYNALRVLVNLCTMMDRLDFDVPGFAREIENAGREAASEKLRDPEGGWGRARARFEQFLSIKSVVITAKSHDLLSESEKVFCDARIVSDMRPVFTRDAEQSPDAFLMIHTLRLSFHTNGRLETIDVAMDSADVSLLRDATRRAEKKETSATALVEKSGASVIRATSHEE